ncbi:hypothetical protein C664_02230 [Thauera sp. 63]|nr:hypothetical protein C664_02230 [Thauera sp. 63]
MTFVEMLAVSFQVRCKNAPVFAGEELHDIWDFCGDFARIESEDAREHVGRLGEELIDPAL